MPEFRVLPAEDTALVVDFGDQQVLALAHRVDEARLNGVVETVPTHRSLIVHYDPIRRLACSESLTLTDLIVNFALRTRQIVGSRSGEGHQMRYDGPASTWAGGEIYYPDRRS